jgi:hypothetical protein
MHAGINDKAVHMDAVKIPNHIQSLSLAQQAPGQKMLEQIKATDNNAIPSTAHKTMVAGWCSFSKLDINTENV